MRFQVSQDAITVSLLSEIQELQDKRIADVIYALPNMVTIVMLYCLIMWRN